MTFPTDAALLVALDTQYRQLSELRARLEHAQATLLPPPATFWIGSARLAYDSAITSLGHTLEGAVLAVRSAAEYTARARSEVIARG
jgi:hypothetical protein